MAIREIEQTGSALRPLRVLLVASLLVPALLLGVMSWSSYRSHFAQAEERISREADVLHEHASKVFETAELVIRQVNERLRGLGDDAIRSDESALHDELAAMVRTLPQMRDVWVVDGAGKSLLSAVFHPVRRDLDLSDRDYFVAARDHAGTFVGDLVTGRSSNSVYFNIGGRREPAGAAGFAGAIAVAIYPQYFAGVYDKLFGSPAGLAGLAREDGAVLVRYPNWSSRPVKLSGRSNFIRNITRAPEHGLYRTMSEVDGTDRIIAYRRLERFPVYVYAGRDTGSIAAAWRETVAGHLLLGVPSALCLFGITFVAMRRTERERRAVVRATEEARRRELAEEAMRQAQKMEAVGQLTGGVAHDFNNLLLIVNGNVELLRSRLAGQGERKALDAIARAAARGESLTRQLLSFSRRQTLRPVVLDLPARLRRLRQMLTQSLRGDITVVVDAPADLWRVEVDPGELELALLNIAVNARDAMPSGGTLTVTARNVALAPGQEEGGLSGEFVALAVTDTGGGIAPADLARVFEPFFTTKEVGKGTGLGLSQVYGFAHQSGGTARIDSALGAGTCVTLYLPRSLGTPPRADDDEETGAERLAAGRRRRVLLVEDNPEVAETSAALLEELGLSVERAGNAADALALIAQRRPELDLVLSDIVMPGGMSGLDLARALRARFPDLPVLLTSGYSEGLRDAEADGFILLRKPFKLADLERGLAAALAANPTLIEPSMP